MPYVDEDLDKMTFPDLGEQITQEVGNQYVSTSIMLLCGKDSVWYHKGMQT